MGTQARRVCLVAMLVLGLAAPVLAQGVTTPTPPNPGGAAPSPGIGAPPGPGGPYFYRQGPMRGPGFYRGRGNGWGRFGRRRFGGVGILFFGLFGLLRLLLLIGLIVLVWRVLTARGVWDRWGRRADPGAEILRERYARGEIDQDEYRKRLAGLG